MLLQFSRRHARVAGDARLAREPCLLPLPRHDDSLANRLRAFPGLLGTDVAKFHLWHFDVEVDSVK